MNHVELTDEEYQKFCELIYRVAGIRIADNKRVMVEQPRAPAAAGHRDRQLRGVLHLPDLARRQRRDASVPRRDHDQRDLLLPRHPALRLAGRRRSSPRSPAQAALRKRPKSLRIWSAACSTGEEPYSIALKVLGKKPLLRRLADHDPGTDLSGAVLDAARAGSYDARAVRLVEPAQRLAFFDEDPQPSAGPSSPRSRRWSPGSSTTCCLHSRKNRSTVSFSKMC